MDRKEFNGLFKDLMAHLYDLAALETHTLTRSLEPPADYSGSRGEWVRRLVLDQIEQLKPPGKKMAASAIEWRPYLILHKRYVEGAGLPELASYLAIGERQMRRDNSRALEALAGRLWDQIFRAPAASPTPGAAEDGELNLQAFEAHLEMLNLNDVLQGVVATVQKRVQDEEIDLGLGMAGRPLLVLADRVMLRQILISLFNYALHMQSGNKVHMGAAKVEKQAVVSIGGEVDENWTVWHDLEREDLLKSARYWAGQLHAKVVESHPERGQAGGFELRLSIPLAGEAVILVVDDQKPAINMFQRYLSRTSFKVVGVTDPAQVLPLARQMQPALITLDVMMPRVDGWEILQALQLDVQTRHIPVIVCSAWEEPELAKSLGAAGFLKKPVTQKDLLAALEQIILP